MASSNLVMYVNPTNAQIIIDYDTLDATNLILTVAPSVIPESILVYTRNAEDTIVYTYIDQRNDVVINKSEQCVKGRIISESDGFYNIVNDKENKFIIAKDPDFVIAPNDATGKVLIKNPGKPFVLNYLVSKIYMQSHIRLVVTYKGNAMLYHLIKIVNETDVEFNPNTINVHYLDYGEETKLNMLPKGITTIQLSKNKIDAELIYFVDFDSFIVYDGWSLIIPEILPKSIISIYDNTNVFVGSTELPESRVGKISFKLNVSSDLKIIKWERSENKRILAVDNRLKTSVTLKIGDVDVIVEPGSREITIKSETKSK